MECILIPLLLVAWIVFLFILFKPKKNTNENQRTFSISTKQERERRKMVYGDVPPLYTMFGVIGNPNYYDDELDELIEKNK